VEELHVELIVLHDQDSLGHPRSFACPPIARRGDVTDPSIGAAKRSFKLVTICYGKVEFKQYQQGRHIFVHETAKG
jgi:hypothetical protein